MGTQMITKRLMIQRKQRETDLLDLSFSLMRFHSTLFIQNWKNDIVKQS